MNFLNRFKYARDSYFVTVLIVAIVVLLNFIAARHFVRVDLTQNQLYAVSDASKNIMRELDDIVTVKVFFSEKLPPNLFAVRQYVGDILDEFSSYSDGDLIVEYMNPAEPDVMNEAISLGIPQIRMNIVEKDKFEVKNGFLGIAVSYGNRTEILPVIQSILNVEYDLAAAIKKVTASEDRTVAFVTGHEEPTLEDRLGVQERNESYVQFKQALSKNYNVTDVDLAQDGSLSHVNTLIVAGSRTEFTEDEQYAIDQYLMEGGNIMFFLDSVAIEPGLQTSALSLGLDDMLDHYGIRIENHLLLDRSNESASFNQGYVNFFVPYPFWIKALNANFNTANPIVNKLDSFVLPWTSSLRLTDQSGVESTVLASTTDAAWSQKEPFNLDPSLLQASRIRNQYTVVAMLEGQFKSFFEDKDEEGHLDIASASGRIFVIPNSRFVTDQFVRLYGQNLVFAMNAIDYLTLDESLISIRSKSAFELPLKDLSSRDRQIVKYIGTFLMPILVVIFGIIRLLARQRKKYVF